MFPVIHDAALFANGGNGTIVETRWENYEGLSIPPPKITIFLAKERVFQSKFFFVFFFFGGGRVVLSITWGKPNNGVLLQLFFVMSMNGGDKFVKQSDRPLTNYMK